MEMFFVEAYCNRPACKGTGDKTLIGLAPELDEDRLAAIVTDHIAEAGGRHDPKDFSFKTQEVEVSHEEFDA